MITTILTLLPLILTDVLTADLTGNNKQCTVLDFQTTSGSTLTTKPDFSSATKSLSYCMWYKKEQAGESKVLLNYRADAEGGSEMYISDDADGLTFMRDAITSSKPTVPLNKWMHVCFTWSRASRVMTYYLNGEVLGTGTSADRDLDTTATLYIGGYYNGETARLFGGQMTGLSFYGAKLTTEQVMFAYKDGPCSLCNYSQLLPKLILGWTEIQKLTRPATVTEKFIKSENCNLSDLLDLTPEIKSQLIQELKEDMLADDELMKELCKNSGTQTKGLNPDLSLEIKLEGSFWDLLHTSHVNNKG